jgi:glutamate N-acetyltransferase/amino-acid N-acetyltransferase
MTFGPPAHEHVTSLPGGGITSPGGFRAAGVAAGLKASGKPDLALIVSDGRAGAAAVTTTNQVKAAPCIVTEDHIADGYARAVIVNAGNANACTGEQGLRDASDTCDEAARLLGCAPDDIIPLSTGIIGVRMPTQTLLAGIPSVVEGLGRDPQHSAAAAEAITTTDTHIKQVAVEVRDEQGSCRIGGIAKGAGMIEPAMATMLCVLTTDAPLSGAVLRPMLRQAINRTFNRISIDACGSTNDTVVVLASGAATRPPGLAALQAGLEEVCAQLARAIVDDGEGTTKVAEVTVGGARTEADAVALARAVTSSTLFRAALHGADPNWGRVLAAMGTSKVTFDPDRVAVKFAGVTVCRFGTAVVFDRGNVAARMDKPLIYIDVDLGLGDASATLLTADITPAYVAENAYYTT